MYCDGGVGKRENMVESKNDDKIKEFIKHGGEITGGAASSVLGYFAAGPLGAAIGGAIGPIITAGIIEIASRFLSEREIARASAASVMAIIKIKERLDKGQKPRNDDFFNKKNNVQAKAAELYEGMLLKAKSEHEEKKVSIYANLFSSLCFREDISSDEGNWMLFCIERFNYRHFNILYAFYELGTQSLWEWNTVYSLPKEHSVLRAQIEDLKNNNLLSPDFWGDSPVKIMELGKDFIELIDFSALKDDSYEKIFEIIKSKNNNKKSNRV
jgi:hypothetical protein